MKKVLIGILILIPIIILLVVALVTNLLQLQAWIAVEDIIVTDRATGREISSLKPALDVGMDNVYDLNDFVDVVVLPEKANQYSVEWSISNVKCSDEEYQNRYDEYINNPVGTPVYPAAMLVDGAGNETEINTSGKFKVNEYCSFNVSVRAETKTKNFLIYVVGYSVVSVKLTDAQGSTSATMPVGQSKRLSATFIPLDSIVTELVFASSDESIATVDENGVVTAVGVGNATITATADKHNHSENESGTVTSNEFPVTVTAAAGAFGDSVTLERTTSGVYGYDLLGVSQNDVDFENSVGCSPAEGGVAIDGERASLALTDGKTLQIELCDAGQIKIINADLFEHKEEGGYVLGIGDLGLKLRAGFAATARTEAPEGVVWSSDLPSIATVDGNGLVKGVANGVATISARLGSSVSTVTICVHQKVSSLRLKTSNESLAVGLARQTVFASEKYVVQEGSLGGNASHERVANSVEIHLLDEPDGATAAALVNFYEAYAFEISEGAEFAHMDEKTPNLVVFDSAALEGKGLQNVKIKATAKYPQFEASLQNTTDYVTLTVIYGVEVNTYEQAMRASADQLEYALQEDNVIPEELVDSLVAPNGQTYNIVNQQRARRMYAMSIASNFAPPEGCVLGDSSSQYCIRLYGDLYGNGHIVSAKSEQVTNGDAYLFKVAMSGVTLSNVELKHEDREIEKLDAETFIHSYCVDIDGYNGIPKRTVDVRMEYCIFENSKGGINLHNSDTTIDGCVFRNISSVGIYTYARVDSGTPNLVRFAHLNINNTVFSSIIGISISMSFEKLSLDDDGNGRFSNAADKKTRREESNKFVEEAMVPKGYTHIMNQTGFLDIYNWQDAAKVTLINTGDKTYNDMIAALAGPLVTKHPAFAPGVYHGQSMDYFHLGFITSGINVSANVIDERTFLQLTMEDDRFFSIYSRELEHIDLEGGALALRLLTAMECRLYGYKNTSSITPYSTYELNNDFIDHLHGLK